MEEQNEDEQNDLITPGIYKQISLQNNYYNIDDCIPVFVNNEPKLLGEGRFSKVFLYKNKDNDSLFALKKISINKIIESGNNLNIIKREIDIHSRIIHKNIVRFYSLKENINEIYLLLEYCNKGSIYEYISKEGFDENKTYKYFSQVVNAVYFLHKNNIIHRDIKPENILLNFDDIKLCDFGWCCESNSNNRTSFCGTFEYMAPEIINEIPYGKPVDIWALGILLYEFYYGKSPFSSEEQKDTINNILNNRLNFPKWKEISNEMKDLIINMINPDISKRYTIEKVVSHPWFKKCKKENIIHNNNINFYKPENEVNNNIKITKITKNKNNFLYNSCKVNDDNLKIYYNEKFNNKSNLLQSKNILNHTNVVVKKLTNIDINADDSSSNKSEDSINIKDSPIKTNYNNNFKYVNENIIRHHSDKLNNYSFIQGNNQIQNEFTNNRYKISKLNNNYNNLKKTNTINSDKKVNYMSLFPMDSVLEETSNEISDEKLNSVPMHASVIKLDNKKNINAMNKNPINNTSMNKMKNSFKDNINTNNYILNNNYYTINYYSNIGNKSDSKINCGNNIFDSVPFFQNNEYQ